MRRFAPFATAVAFGVSLLPTASHAWGFETHRMIASLAEQQLSSAAKDGVQRLLALEPGATMTSISTWADEQRDRRTAAWHYVNFPRDDCHYDKARDCPDGNCAVEAIGAQVAILKSLAPDAERLTALKFVVHLVGDVHQPLHAGYADDKGGNTFQVQAFGRGSNLHSLWDTGLIMNRPGGAQGLRQEIGATLDGVAAPAPPQAQLWAEESCRIVAQPDFYPQSRTVGEEYRADHDAVLKARIGAAAQRLAATLNDALR